MYGIFIPKVKKFKMSQPNPAFLNQLNQIESLCQQEKFEQALVLLKSLIAVHQKDPILHNFIGKVYAILGDSKEATRAFKKTLNLNKNFIEAYFNMGNVFAQQGKHHEALKHFEVCLKHNIEDCGLFNNMSASYLTLKNFNQANHFCEKALSLNPQFVNALKNRGVIQFLEVEHERNSGQADRLLPDRLMEFLKPKKLMLALDYMNDYLMVNPNDKDIHSYQGLIFTVLRNYQAAEKAFKKSMQVQGPNIKDLRALAKLYHHYDQVHKAIKCEQESLQLLMKTNNTPAQQDVMSTLISYYNNVGLQDQAEQIFNTTEFTDNLEFLNSLRQMMPKLTLIDEQSIYYQRLTRLENNKQLSQLERCVTKYCMALIHKKKKNKELYLHNLKISNELRLKHIQQTKITEENFIDKLGRESLDDCQLRMNLIKNIKLPKLEHEFQPIFVVGMPRSSTTITELIISSHSKVFGCGEVGIISTITRFLTNRIKNKQYSQSDIEEYLLEARNIYVREMSAIKNNETIIVDKMPGNAHNIDIILTLFPNAKIINTDRDPMAVSWSIYSNFFGADTDWVNSLDEIFNEYELYMQKMRIFKQQYQQSIMDSNYDELVNHPKSAIEKLLNFCELPWEEACLNPQENKKAIRTISVNQARSGIYKGSTEAWKEYADFLEPLIQKFKNSTLFDLKI